jgi:hypothetical protein
MAEVTAGHPTEGEGGLAGGSLDIKQCTPHPRNNTRTHRVASPDAVDLRPIERPTHSAPTSHLGGLLFITKCYTL